MKGALPEKNWLSCGQIAGELLPQPGKGIRQQYGLLAKHMKDGMGKDGIIGMMQCMGRRSW